MSPINGALVVGIPLFRYNEANQLTNLEGYFVSITNDKPFGWLLDAGEACMYANHDWVNNKLISMGEL